MVRRALLLSIALAGVLECTDAAAAQATIPVRGNVEAIALAGDALIVGRRPSNGGLAVERLTPGAPAQTLLRLPRSRDDDDTEVTLAASAQALAVGLQLEGEDDFDPSRVLVGPSAGPLREVAACANGLLPPPLAVSGSHIAWLEGGCGVPPGRPRAISPASIAIGGPDAATPLRRVAAGDEAMPAVIVLNGETGLAAVLRPSFFSFFKGEVRRFGPGGFGETIAREDTRIVAPVGVLSNGDSVLFLGELEDDEGGSDSPPARCDSTVFVIAADGSERRPLSLGGCPDDDDFPTNTVRVSGDRVYSLVNGRPRRNSRAPTAMAITSIRGDGRDARVLARGTYRSPRGIATAESGRVAWWQRRCAGGFEVVIDDGAPPASATAIPSCSAKVLDRSVRVRRGTITLRLRCRSGCSGVALAPNRRSRRVRSFSFGPGTHSLRLHLTRGERRRNRLRLKFDLRDGPSSTAVIRLR